MGEGGVSLVTNLFLLVSRTNPGSLRDGYVGVGRSWRVRGDPGADVFLLFP